MRNIIKSIAIAGAITAGSLGLEPKELVVKLRRDSPEPRHRPFATDDALASASTEELLLELRRRIIRPRERRRESWDDMDGLEPQGYWSEQN